MQRGWCWCTGSWTSSGLSGPRRGISFSLLLHKKMLFYHARPPSPIPVPGNLSLIKARREVCAQPGSGWGFLAEDLGLGWFRATSQCTPADLGFFSPRNDFHPLPYPRGLVRKPKKHCRRFAPSIPKCKPLGSSSGIWQLQECTGIQEALKWSLVGVSC